MSFSERLRVKNLEARGKLVSNSEISRFLQKIGGQRVEKRGDFYAAILV